MNTIENQETLKPLGSSPKATFNKDTIEIHVKGYTLTGKTTIASLIEKALVANGVANVTVQSTDNDHEYRQGMDSDACVKSLNNRGIKVVVVDNNEKVTLKGNE